MGRRPLQAARLVENEGPTGGSARTLCTAAIRHNDERKGCGMNLSTILLLLVIGLYFAAFVRYLFEFLNLGRTGRSWAGRLVEGGFLIHTLEIFVRTFSVSQTMTPRFYVPVRTLGETSSFFAWSLAFIYFILVKRHRTEGFGLALAPVLILFLVPSFVPLEARPVWLPDLNNHYFLMHILWAFFGYAGFALSFIAGVLYLTQNRALKLKIHIDFYHNLPPLEELERFIFRTIFWGLVLLGGAIVTGGFWTKSAFGTFLLIEPKSMAALATWLVYLLIMLLHEVSLMKGRRVVLMSVWAFALVLFTFLGTSVLRPGLHVGV